MKFSTALALAWICSGLVWGGWSGDGVGIDGSARSARSEGARTTTTSSVPLGSYTDQRSLQFRLRARSPADLTSLIKRTRMETD